MDWRSCWQQRQKSRIHQIHQNSPIRKYETENFQTAWVHHHIGGHRHISHVSRLRFWTSMVSMSWCRLIFCYSSVFIRNVHGPSKWCTAFTKEDLKFMEYGGDLLTYYKNGYGSAEYNGKLGCPILKDLYDKLNKKVTGKNANLVVLFYIYLQFVNYYH